MKKIICIVLTILLMLSFSATAIAAEFELDPHGKMDGMGKSWYQGYEPSISYHTMTIHLPIRAESCVGDITVSIALDDPHVFLLDSQPKTVTVSPRNGLYPVKLSLSLERYRRNGDYQATITVSGKTESGEEITETIPYIIRIRDGYSNHETMKPVISNVTGDLNVGSDGSLSLTITNPTTTQSILEGEITVTDATGDIIISGSNRVLIPEVLPGKSEVISIPVVISGNASVSLHTLEVKLTYTALSAEKTWTESFAVPVTQAIRLEQGGVSMPTAIAGELGNMSLQLMNMGKGELQNVLVKLSMDGVLEEQSVLVGAMTPGETKQAKLTFTPNLDSVGIHSGTVIITCEDAYGNAYTQTLDVTLTVEEPIPELDQEPEKKDEKMGKGMIVMIVLCVLMAAGLVAQGAILTKKIHHLEEERL